MAKLIRGASPTSVVMRIKLMNSSVTTGAGLTGLTNASSGLIISTIRTNESSATVYTVAASNVETIATLGTYAAPSANKCRFKEVDATNHPGLYELQFADARFTSIGLIISISGATNLAQGDFEIQCENISVNVIQVNGTAQTARDLGASVLLSSGTGTGQLDFTSGVVKSNLSQILGTALTETAGQIAAAFKQFFNIATPASTMDSIVAVGRINSAGYADAAVWIDTVNGSAGTTSWINGTQNNPVDNLADAKTIADALKIKRFRIISGSSITLDTTYTYYEFIGERWTLNLNGKTAWAALFQGAVVSGSLIAPMGATIFRNCEIAAASIPWGTFFNCYFSSTLTITGSETYIFDNCYSAQSFILNFGSGVGPSPARFAHFSGKIEIQYFGLGSDVMYIQGEGEIVINANCTAGVLNVSGNFKITDNSAGAVTVNDDANFPTALNLASGIVEANIKQISDDATAADNLELDYDGTGYNKANSTIGTCTANTDMRGTNSALLAASAPTNFGALAITAAGKVTVGTNDDKTGYSISGTITTLDGLNDLSAAEVQAECEDAIDAKFNFTGTYVDAQIKATDDIGLSTTQKADVNTQADSALVDYDSSNGVAKEASVLSIQNNTRFVSSIPSNLLVPDSGNTVYKFVSYFYDSDGNMEDPDSNEIALKITTAGGTAKTALYDEFACTTPATSSGTFPGYYKMVRIGVGRYETFYKLPSTETPDQWLFDFALNENSSELHYSRTTIVVEENPGSTTLADNSTNKDIIAKSLKSQDVSATSAVSGSIHKDINDNIDAVDTSVGTVDGKVDDIKAVTDVIPNSGAMTDIDSGINNIEGKLPSKDYLAGTDNIDGSIELDAATGTLAAGAFDNIPKGTGYANGMVWIDNAYGTSGTVPWVNGTQDNPCDNLADAKAIADALKIRKFHIAAGNSLTLAAAMNEYEFHGDRWNLNLNGKSVNDTLIVGAIINGTQGVVTKPTRFRNCEIQSVSVLWGYFYNCFMSTTLTIISTENLILENCFSSQSFIIDFGSGVGPTPTLIKHFSGKVEIKYFGLGSDTLDLEGEGKLIINANCTGGTINVRGNFEITDNAAGVVTVNDDANFPTALNIAAGVVESNVKQVEDVELEGKVGENFDTFFQNGDALTSTVVDDIGSLDAQGVRDAMKLAPSGGAPDTGSIDDLLDVIETDTDEIQGKLPSKTKLMGSADSDGGFDSEAKADINAEVLDVLNVDTIPELAQGAPSAVTSLFKMVARMYSALINKGTMTKGTGAEKKFYNSSGTNTWKKEVGDDGTTYVENQGISG